VDRKKISEMNFIRLERIEGLTHLPMLMNANPAQYGGLKEDVTVKYLGVTILIGNSRLVSPLKT
tara:strand:- start:4466 stop:4657 length:192 start_codon:yes stop_codon:yes gene_type:complete